MSTRKVIALCLLLATFGANAGAPSAEKDRDEEEVWRAVSPPGTKKGCPIRRTTMGWQFGFTDFEVVGGSSPVVEQSVKIDGEPLEGYVRFNLRYRPKSKFYEEGREALINFRYRSYVKLDDQLDATITFFKSGAQIAQAPVTLTVKPSTAAGDYNNYYNRSYEGFFGTVFFQDLARLASADTLHVTIPPFADPYVVQLNLDNLDAMMKEMSAPYAYLARREQGLCSIVPTGMEN